MPFDAREIFANLVEKERIKGHHSPEGRAMRILSRALNGWSSGSLLGRDVLALCDQAIEDWLKVRLKVSPWAERPTPVLLLEALKKQLITHLEAVQLQKVANLAARSGTTEFTKQQVETALGFCIQLIDRHW